MSGPLNGARPATHLCRKVKCPELKEHFWETGVGRKKSYYCSLTISPGLPLGRIPGNISRCPKEVPA
jgi:hypothetical protein